MMHSEHADDGQCVKMLSELTMAAFPHEPTPNVCPMEGKALQAKLCLKADRKTCMDTSQTFVQLCLYLSHAHCCLSP